MGPFMMGKLDLAMRAHFRSKGFSFFKINRLMTGFSANSVNMAVAEADIDKPGVASQFEDLTAIEDKIGAPASPLTQAEEGSVSVIGDGKILQQLVAAWKAFAASDFGKALIAMLEKALIGFLIP